MEKTAHYRSKDPLRNFLIKVNLRKVTSASVLGATIANLADISAKPKEEEEEEEKKINANNNQFNDPLHQGAGQEVSPASNLMQVPEEHETKILSWQLKCFSRHEVDLYQDAKNCISPLHESYHDEIVNLLGSEERESERHLRVEGRVFTYVDNDEFDNIHEATRCVTTSPKEAPSFLASRMLDVRRRHGDKVVRKAAKNAEGVILNEKQKASRVVDTAFQRMHIMADVSANDPSRSVSNFPEEIVLCAISIYANGAMEIQPDFSQPDGAPYRVESLHGDVFEYTLEHASPQISPDDHLREMAFKAEMTVRKNELMLNRVGEEFESRPALHSAMRLYVYGEIVQAIGFDYDEIYVRMVQSVPSGWTSPSNPTSSEEIVCTQISRACKNEKGQKVWNFSFPFEMVFESNASSQAPPMLFFHVASLDSWERHRTEGYAYLAIPMLGGMVETTLSTWRPLGDRYSAMRRFFLGGSPELSDITSVNPLAGQGSPLTTPPSSTNESHPHNRVLSKFGFATQGSGSIVVRLSVVVQKGAHEKGSDALIKAKRPPPLQSLTVATSTVIAAFQRAQKRLSRVAGMEALHTSSSA